MSSMPKGFRTHRKPMAPLPRTLPPWRWNLGQHLCTAEAPALGPRKTPGLGEKNHSTKKKNQGAALRELLQTRPTSFHCGGGGGGSRILGLSQTLSSGQ